MYKDKVIAGIILGLLADTVKLITNYTMFHFNLTKITFWQITATRFLKKDDLFQPIAYLIGGIADITITSIIGISFIYLISYIGREYLWVKGIGFGMTIWVVLFGTLLGQSAQKKLPQEPLAIIVTIIAHFVYGLAFAFFYPKFFPLEKRDS